MKVVVAEAERERTRGPSRRHAKAKAAFFFGYLLILSQFCCLSSAENSNGIAPSHWSPARKARFFHTSSSFHASTLRTNDDEIIVGRDDQNNSTGTDKIFQDDKRIVHTGPNPLHN